MGNPLLWIGGALVCLALVFWLPTLNLPYIVDFSTAPATAISLIRLSVIILVFWCMINVVGD